MNLLMRVSRKYDDHQDKDEGIEKEEDEDYRHRGKPHVRILGVQPEFCRKGCEVESPCQIGCGSFSVNMNHY